MINKACFRIPLSSIQNAGVAPPTMPIEDLTLDTLRQALDINLVGPFLCTREAFKTFKAQQPVGGELARTMRLICIDSHTKAALSTMGHFLRMFRGPTRFHMRLRNMQYQVSQSAQLSMAASITLPALRLTSVRSFPLDRT